MSDIMFEMPHPGERITIPNSGNGELTGKELIVDEIVFDDWVDTGDGFSVYKQYFAYGKVPGMEGRKCVQVHVRA